MSTYKSDSDGYSSESVYGSYGIRHDQKSCSGDSSRLDSVPGSRWWSSRHAPRGEYSHELLNVLSAEVKLTEAGDVNENGKLRGENQLIEEYCTSCPKKDADFCSDAPLKHSCSHFKNNEDSWFQEFEATNVDDLLSNADLMGLVSRNSHLLEQSKKLSSDLDSHWIGLKKTEPWWHAGDKDEVSVVSQTSAHHIRDSDCRGVQVSLVEKISDNHIDSFDQFNEQIMNKEVLNAADSAEGSVTSVSLGKSLTKQGIMEHLLQESDATFSNKEGSKPTNTDSSDTQEPTTSALTRAQLLEALCHSQTRAREAEKLAQQACDEKKYVVNLFFQQASWLFAYRQWLRLLQLESLCLHLRSKTQLPPFTPPSFLPWVQNKKGTVVRKNRNRTANKRQGKQRCNMSKCTIAFAVGVSLASAGLLVGWTIGWLFPAF